MRPLNVSLACILGWLVVAEAAWAWPGSDEIPVADRVLTLTVQAKGWNLGGVAVDQIGSVYVADFAETVWKVTPEGEVLPFATGFYGASGSAIDARGELYQASFYGNTISRIDRRGEVSPYVTEGLSGPVGIAIGPDGALYVCNCRGNSIARVSVERQVSELVSLAGWTGCPNGITFGPEGKLYVVGFGRPNILEITLEGAVRSFVHIPGSWLGHLVFAGGQFYVTSYGTHEIYRVDPSGGYEVLAGSLERGIAGGALHQARFSNPNGIAASASGQTLYINNFDAEWRLPGRGKAPAPLVLSRIDLVSLTEKVLAGLESGGKAAAAAAYREHKRDPRQAGANTERLMNLIGYWLLTRQRYDDAITVYELNAESYPESVNVWNSLADGHLRRSDRDRGDRDRARELYEKSLELDPDNANARQKLQSLVAD
ncbi:MAG: hypothetical protein AAF657_28635 [Acidobacteriota bacterium]